MSQIDIAPTVLGLLNFSYRSRFYGYDLFQLEPGRERAFTATTRSSATCTTTCSPCWNRSASWSR